MQKLKRLDDLFERDAERIDGARRAASPSHFQAQINATTEEIKQAFRGGQGRSEGRSGLKAKMTGNA